MADLQARIEELWNRASELSPADVDASATVNEAIDLLDAATPEWPRSGRTA